MFVMDAGCFDPARNAFAYLEKISGTGSLDQIISSIAKCVHHIQQT